MLFNVIERSVNYVFNDDKSPTAQWARVLSYALEAYKVYIERMIV